MEHTKLAQARIEKCWTLGQAADRIGVNLHTLWRWEHGEAKPRAYNVHQLCKIYGATAAELGIMATTYLDSDQVRLTTTNAGQGEESDEIHTLIKSDVTMRLLSLAYLPLPFQELQDKMVEILDESDNSVSRREALQRLIAFPSLSFGASEFVKSMYGTSSIIAQCAAGIAACREISKSPTDNSSDIGLAFRGVSAYLPVLRAILRDSSAYRKQAANLAAQCLRVKAMLALHVENLVCATSYAREAVAYAREADDPSLLVSALISHSWICYYGHHDSQSMIAMDEAVASIKQSNLPKSLAVRALSTQAVMQAKSGIDSRPTLRLAHGALHSSPGSDYFAFSGAMLPELIGNEAMTYYHRREYNKAMGNFDQLIDPENLSSKMSLSGKARVEMLNFMALSNLKMPTKDLETVVHFWQAGLKGAKTMQSHWRFHDALTIYDVMETAWPGEKRVHDLREQLVHW